MATGITVCVECGVEKFTSHLRPNTRHKDWKCRPCAHKGLPTWNTGLAGTDHPGLKRISEGARQYWTPKRRDQHRLNMEAKGHWTPLSAKSELDQYKQQVRMYTQRNNLKVLPNYDKVGHTEGGTAYTLNHKFSVHEGFKQGIPAKIIGNLVNLHCVICSVNSSKHTSCSITKEELYELYEAEGR